LYYGTIKKNDIADGIGVRVSLFVSGCTNHCEGCFQPETWSFTFGKEYTKETEQEIIDALKPSHIRGLTLLGGEPFEPENQLVLVTLLRRVRAELPDKDVWAYTGFRIDDDLAPAGIKHCAVTDEMLSYVDVLVDGRFVISKRNIALAFRGSENQRIIDVKRTLTEGKVVTLEYGKTSM
jgi:anaerobic ribonucleoside-triphosphate reductase activating protein